MACIALLWSYLPISYSPLLIHGNYKKKRPKHRCYNLIPVFLHCFTFGVFC